MWLNLLLQMSVYLTIICDHGFIFCCINGMNKLIEKNHWIARNCVPYRNTYLGHSVVIIFSISIIRVLNLSRTPQLQLFSVT